ncbi:MAG TPA: DUF2059 domain-containing protein [Allosphingosinicella sp.]|nr:DUF2059 domain-containing protein [Allosphingosinicella sp.]
MRAAIFAALLFGASAPAISAQTPETTPPGSGAPAPAVERPDPARIAAAGRLIDLMMPPGSMRELMGDLMPTMDTILAMTAERLGIDTQGMSSEQRARAVERLGAQSDRHFRERLQITLDVSVRVTSEILAELEPDMRRVLVTLMARQFDQAELGEMIAFFDTPTGRKYARMAFTMGRDPAWQEVLTLMVPRMTEADTRIQAAVRDATAHLDPLPQI